jgi:hypothetical protein
LLLLSTSLEKGRDNYRQPRVSIIVELLIDK